MITLWLAGEDTWQVLSNADPRILYTQTPESGKEKIGSTPDWIGWLSTFNRSQRKSRDMCTGKYMYLANGGKKPLVLPL